MKKLHIGFMASHGGSNMQAIIDAINDGRLHAKACLLVSNNSQSMAIVRAMQSSNRGGNTGETI